MIPSPLLHSWQLLCLALVSPIIQILVSGLLSLVLLYLYPRCMLLYLTYIYFDSSPQRGGWRLRPLTRFLKNLSIWRIVAGYFPARIVKTAELPGSTGPYLFGYHPHGVISAGALLNFGTNASGFEELYPDVDVHVLGAKALFRVPFFREWLLAHGGGSVGRKTCGDCLKRGESIMIVIGGARESLEAHQDTRIVLTIKERKGFVRVALKAGAALVPVVSFGENDLFAQVPNPQGSGLRRLQERLLNLFGYALPSFFGVGSFPLALPRAGVGSLQYGLLPFQRPLTVVVGSPIPVPRPGTEEPTAEEVDKYHQLYLDALVKLYDEQKGEVYGKTPGMPQTPPEFVLH